MMRRMPLRVYTLAAVAWAVAVPSVTAQTVRAFTNARLITISGDGFAPGAMVVEGSRIAAVGKAEDVVIPEGAEVTDCGGRVIMPGLVCTHSHIGGIGAADGSGPVQPGVRVYESLNVYDSGFRRALAGGLTTLNIMPGSSHLIGGQTIYVKLRFFDGPPRTIDRLFYHDREGRPLGGLKMANGTNSMRDPPFPGTRGKSAYLVRQQYIKAREYRAKIERAGGDPKKVPERDLDLETLIEAMRGDRTVHHHTHRHDDIITAIRISQEFHFPIVLHHVSEAWRVADEIAAAKVPCSILLLDSPGGKLEARHLEMANGKILEEAGVRVAFHTDDWITDSRLFLRMAALGVRAGMSRRAALEAVTLAGAEMLGLNDRIGSLEPGKDADFVILDGDPLSVYTKVLETWVEGRRVFELSSADDRLYAVGGYGAGRDQSPYYCCFGSAESGSQ